MLAITQGEQAGTWCTCVSSGGDKHGSRGLSRAVPVKSWVKSPMKGDWLVLPVSSNLPALLGFQSPPPEGPDRAFPGKPFQPLVCTCPWPQDVTQGTAKQGPGRNLASPAPTQETANPSPSLVAPIPGKPPEKSLQRWACCSGFKSQTSCRIGHCCPREPWFVAPPLINKYDNPHCTE